MFWTGDFWLNWAVKEAQSSWKIYREPPTPKVVSVAPDPEHGFFLVEFANGEKFKVIPSGIAKPL